MHKLFLIEFVKEFAAEVAPVVLVSLSADTERNLAPEETLHIWMQLPECHYTPMFLGWMIAHGEDINDFSPLQMHEAVQAAAIGNNKTLITTEGDLHGTNKPH